MSAPAVAALVLVCAWLGALTLIVVLLVRQIGLLTVRLNVASQALSLDDDGPEVGSSVPEEVASVLPGLERVL
jgi:Na+/H+ antiporter NhaB